MQRDEAHVAAVVEDLLRAVAVVVVDVEDRDPRASVRPRRRRDRGVVEEAVARVRVGGRVMAGRARAARTRRASRPIGRPRPTRSSSRRLRRSPPPTCRRGSCRCRASTNRAPRSGAPGPTNGWPRIARAYGTASASSPAPVAVAPARVHVLEELDVLGRVHAEDRARAERLAGSRIGPIPAASIAARMRSARSGTSGGIDHAALVVERLARMVLAVRVRGEREHPVAVARARTASATTEPWSRPVPSVP